MVWISKVAVNFQITSFRTSSFNLFSMSSNLERVMPVFTLAYEIINVRTYIKCGFRKRLSLGALTRAARSGFMTYTQQPMDKAAEMEHSSIKTTKANYEVIEGSIAKDKEFCR